MVQSVGSLPDSFTLFQSGGATRAASGAPAGSIASFGATAQSGSSSDASTSSIASILDNSQTPATSGDFANVFQRLSAGLQSLVVQLQSITTGTSASSTTATTPPTADETASDGASSTATTTADTAAGTTAALTTGADAMRTEAMHRPSGGNRALQGDVDAMINDLRGFTQVGNGDVMSASGVNDNTTNAPPAASTTGASSSENSSTAASQSAASDIAAANALGETTYGYAQNLMQALQNYSVASGNVANTQRNAIVSATG